MKQVRDLIGQPMKWVQTNAKERTYQLRAGDDVLATLVWQKPSGSLALGETSDGKWTFKRTGFFSPIVTVRAAGSEADIAVFTPDWYVGRGTLEMASGTRYRWTTTNFWRSEIAFCDETGQPLVQYKPEWLLQLACAKVEVAPAGDAVSELSLLTVLGWYFMLMMAEEVTTASVTASMINMG
jgi:hypothetical protein